MNKEYIEGNWREMGVDQKRSGWILYRKNIVGGACEVDKDVVRDNEGCRGDIRVADVG